MRTTSLIVKSALEDIIFCTLLLLSVPSTLLLLKPVEAQGQNALTSTPPNNSNVFSTYENHEYGFEVSYPLEWQKIEFIEDVKRSERNVVTNFLSLHEGSSDKFREYVIIEVSDSMPEHWLSDYIEEQIGEYKELFQGFKLIESPSSEIASDRTEDISSKYKIVFTYEDPAVGIVKIREQYFQNMDRVYILSLHSEATSYGNYLPILQTMVNSFHIKT